MIQEEILKPVQYYLRKEMKKKKEEKWKLLKVQKIQEGGKTTQPVPFLLAIYNKTSELFPLRVESTAINCNSIHQIKLPCSNPLNLKCLQQNINVKSRQFATQSANLFANSTCRDTFLAQQKYWFLLTVLGYGTFHFS